MERLVIMRLALVVLACCVPMNQGQTCNVETIQVQRNFNPARFTGRWWYARILPFSWLPAGSLYSDFFVQMTERSHGFDALWYGRILGTPGCTNGGGKVYRTNEPAKYLAEQEFNRTSTFNVTSWVIATDYENYALLYGCSEGTTRGRCNDPTIAMLSRWKQLDRRYLDIMANLVPGLCVGGRAFAIVDVPQTQECFSACHSERCKNGGTCNDWEFDPGYYCWCAPGYTGYNCTEVIDQPRPDACTSHQCQNGATCSPRSDFSRGYECRCAFGYTGSLCADRRDACTSHQCQNGATCSPRSDFSRGYECRCAFGYTGSLCADRRDACTSHQCQNGATCSPRSDFSRGYECRCAFGYTGSLCADRRDACTSHQCQNGATCSPRSDFSRGYECRCAFGYTGSLCADRTDACDRHQCQNGATCSLRTDFRFGYECLCPWGFRGTLCTDRAVTDVCFRNPCRNGGTCRLRSDFDVGYECICPSGFRGALCTDPFVPVFTQEDCVLNPCYYGARCKLDASKPAGYECLCGPGTSGSYCQNVNNARLIDNSLCPVNPCANGGVCTVTITTARGRVETCRCPIGFSGSLCDIPEQAVRTPCDDRPCQNRGVCTDIDRVNRYCTCSVDFTGQDCEIRRPRPCENNPCQNGGSCRETDSNNFVCDCMGGYSGSTCSDRIDPCLSSPCHNSAICQRRSASSFECVCASGFSGTLCDVVLDPCRGNPCRHGGTCRSFGVTFDCVCPAGYEGLLCQDRVVSPCSPQPCSNGGTCVPSGQSYYCQCTSDYEGSQCQNQVFRPCSPQPCSNGGTCVPSGQSYYCQCSSDYEGSQCQNQVFRPCSRQPCINGGTCVPNGQNYYCQCSSDYEGRHCENQVFRPCNALTCLNGGTCVPSGQSFFCQCPSDYRGNRCQSQVFNPCSSQPCLNGGGCVANGQSFSCQCLSGYSGNRCERLVLPCDSSPCRNGGTCVNVNSAFRCSCGSGWTGTTCDRAATLPRGADIVFVIDTSRSVTDYNFRNRILPLIAQTVERLDIGPSYNQIAIVTFNDEARVVIKLNDYQTRPSLASAIRNLRYDGRPATNISGGIAVARSVLTSPAYGARQGNAKLAVFIIDGDSSLDSHRVAPEARESHDAGIKMFTIGIGGWVRQGELDDITSDPNERNGLRISNFAALQNPATRDFLFRVLREYMGQGSIVPTPVTPVQPDTGIDNNLPGTTVWTCGFENTDRSRVVSSDVVTWCNMEQLQSDQLDWRAGSGRTPSDETGPDSAYTGNGYAFLEASQRQQGDKCTLLLPVSSYRGAYCLTVAYNMNGFHIGQLEVDTRRSGRSNLERNWVCAGNRRSGWRLSSVQLNIQQGDELRITGVRGSGFSGDIAIDDLSLRKGSCTSANTVC